MRNKDYLIISVMLFLTVCAWIAFDVYHALTTQTINSEQQKLTEPLTSGFDHELIIDLLNREKNEKRN